MWKTAALGAATLVVAGSMFAYAQQQPGGQDAGGQTVTSTATPTGKRE